MDLKHRYQVGVVVIAGLVAVYVGHLLAPVLSSQLASIITIAMHETGHCLAAFLSGRQVEEIEIRIQSGYVISEGSSQSGLIITTLAGPLLPAAVSAFFLYAATTKQHLYTGLFTIMVWAIVVSQFLTSSLTVEWILLGLGCVCALVFLPITAWLPAIFGFIFACVLGIGVVEAALAFGNEGCMATSNPSDACILAMQFSASDQGSIEAELLREVKVVVNVMIAAIYMASLTCIAQHFSKVAPEFTSPVAAKYDYPELRIR